MPMAIGFWSLLSVATKEVKAWLTSARAFSGSSLSVVVVKEMRWGSKKRDMLWSAGVLGEVSKSVRMQFDAIFAVWYGLVGT